MSSVQSLKFNKDELFWWDTCGRILSRMFGLLNYDVHIQYLHMLFFHTRVAPYMGPRPIRGQDPVFKSYMTDDFTPIEVSWVVNDDGTATVRYAIEPILKDDPTATFSAAKRMIADLRPALPGLDMTWFNIIDDALVLSDTSQVQGAKHLSQYFLGFDCAHNGVTTLKAYFMPEVRSHATGVSKEQLILNALSGLNAGLTVPWQATLNYFDCVPQAIRPEVVILATDCNDPKDSRIKIYVRTKSTTFEDLEGFMTLGGTLNNQVVKNAMTALEDLWGTVMGMDTRTDGWKKHRLQPAVSADANDQHLTGGLLLYYELKPGSALPFPKVYLPVRHYCANDYAIATGMQDYHKRNGKVFVDRYAQDVEFIFGRHRQLSSRPGIHTYITLAIKKSTFEVTRYFNPEAYAPERFV